MQKVILLAMTPEYIGIFTQYPQCLPLNSIVLAWK